jgi:hypothetical protein
VVGSGLARRLRARSPSGFDLTKSRP